MAVGLVTPEVQNSVVFSDPGGVSESFCFSIAVVDEIIVEIEASEVQGCEANILVEDSEASENEVTVISPKRKRHKPNKVEVFAYQKKKRLRFLTKIPGSVGCRGDSYCS